MTVTTALFWCVLLVTPALVLLVVIRLLLAMIRSIRLRRYPSAGWLLLMLVLIIALVVGCATVWFAYGVSHSRKDAISDLLLFVGPAALVCLTCIWAWRMAVTSESRGLKKT